MPLRRWNDEMRIDNFFSKIQTRKRDECWPWIGLKDKAGYGKACWKYKSVRANRLLWELTNGPIPIGMFVMHKCDNPSCMNIRHLRLGTPKDNMQDKCKKGRFRHGLKKLHPSEIIRIRKEYNEGNITQHSLAVRYGVLQNHISRIINKNRWVELP